MRTVIQGGCIYCLKNFIYHIHINFTAYILKNVWKGHGYPSLSHPKQDRLPFPSLPLDRGTNLLPLDRTDIPFSSLSSPWTGQWYPSPNSPQTGWVPFLPLSFPSHAGYTAGSMLLVVIQDFFVSISTVSHLAQDSYISHAKICIRVGGGWIMWTTLTSFILQNIEPPAGISSSQ